MKMKRFVLMIMTVFCFTLAGTQVIEVSAEEKVEAVTQEVESTQEEAEVSVLSDQTGADKKTNKKNKNTKKNKKNKTKKKVVKKTTKPSYTKSELRLMSTIIYCEAGNQSYAGMLGVGIVVMNRKASYQFPNTVREVIYQRGQFTPSWNGALSSALARYDRGQFTAANELACIKAAKEVLEGRKNVTVGGREYNMSSFYFFSRSVSGCRLQIGAHQFK